MRTPQLDAAVQAFIDADRDLMIARAQSVGMLTTYLKSVEGWQDESETERRRFAARAYFQRWCVRQGRCSDG